MISPKYSNLLSHIFFISSICILVYLPLYRAAIVSPPGTYFPLVHNAVTDYFGYISYIRQGKIQWNQTNQFTPEDISSKQTHMLYMLWGKIGIFSDINPFILYHLLIATSILIYYIYTYKLVHMLLPASYKFWTLCIVFFASPFPPYNVHFFGQTLDIGQAWWTRLDPYSRLSLVPHHFLGISLFLANVYYFLRFYQEKRFFFAYIICMVNIISIYFYGIPGFIFTIAMIIIVIGRVFSLKSPLPKDKIIGGVLPVIFFSILAFLYVSGTFSPTTDWSNTVKWEYDNYNTEETSSRFSYFFFAYGLLPYFAAFAFPKIVKKRRFEYIVIAIFFILPFLLYQFSIHGFLYINKMRFLHSTPYVFGGILAMVGIKEILEKFHKKPLHLTLKVIIFYIFLINSIFGLHAYWWGKLTTTTFYSNIYIDNKKLHAISYLNGVTPQYTPIMTQFYTGMYIPGFSYAKVFVGHTYDTKNYFEKIWYSDRFFEGALSADEAKSVLRKYNLQYVFWDNGMLLPEKYSPFLKSVFQEGDVVVYKVI